MNEIETKILPNGEEVSFFADTHKYVVGGEVLPSITTLLKLAYGDIYASVNPGMLKRSADYGTQVHGELQSLIDMRESGIEIDDLIASPTTHQETKNYFTFIEPIYKVKPIVTEKIVVLHDDQNRPVAAGRFDLLAKVNDMITLCDFKTTGTIHKNLVTAQLNLYLRAAIQTGYLPATQTYKLAVIHLSGETCKLIPIPVLGDQFIKRFTEFTSDVS